MLNIKELLQLRGLDTTKKIKLVRHFDNRQRDVNGPIQRFDVYMLHRHGHLETYQSYQAKPIFECDYIVSFLGLEKNKAKLIGVYKVKGQEDPNKVTIPSSFPYQEFANSPVYYDLERCPGFEDFFERVVIDWGAGALAWHQWLSEKEVVEILPKGYLMEFPGYQGVMLEFADLVTIINNLEANREWHTRLSSVAGIYLIVDAKTGKQYVG